MKKLLLLSALAASLSTVGLASAADEPAPPPPSPPAPALATPQPDVAVAQKPESPFKPITLTINPLSLALGRIGANIEYLPVRHHAIVLNPFFQSLSVGADNNKTSYTNFGGELGYHFYTGDIGASGFYFGPSLFAMNSNASASVTMNGKSTTASHSIFVYGAAFDVGGQYVAKNGFTIGAGAGAMYLAANDTNTATTSSFKVSGVLPRILFTIGYSF